MNNETASLLNKLAEKLGTTAENLWAILLHQAPVDATTTLIQCLLFLLAPVITYKVHRRILKMEYGYDDGYGIVMIIAAIISLALIITVICSISTIINGYFNPQYWALEKILDTLKSAK